MTDSPVNLPPPVALSRHCGIGKSTAPDFARRAGSPETGQVPWEAASLSPVLATGAFKRMCMPRPYCGSTKSVFRIRELGCVFGKGSPTLWLARWLSCMCPCPARMTYRQQGPSRPSESVRTLNTRSTFKKSKGAELLLPFPFGPLCPPRTCATLVIAWVLWPYTHHS